MLRKSQELLKYTLRATDGEIGKIADFYFDDRHWTIRYLVANTGNWLTERLVLMSPYALTSVDEERRTIAVSLTREQIEKSPLAESDKPVSRQFEASYHEYYNWPAYWFGPYAWGEYAYPAPIPPPTPTEALAEEVQGNEEISWDSHLRNVQDVEGYGVAARDGEIGHVADFLIEDKTWAIRYLVVDTRNWWPGKHVLVSPQWIERVSWIERAVHVDLGRDTIKDAPEYRRDSPITRDYEIELCRHYGREGYWTHESCSREAAPATPA